MAPLFSIIIPVYNATPYLRECLDSVLAQKFTDWETICVDDGSTDGSDAILDEYSAKDSRFHIVHKKNEGVSKARNTALDAVAGEWFLFLDADDALAPRCLSLFYSVIKKYGDADGILTRPIFSPVMELSTSDWWRKELSFETGSDDDAISVNEIQDRLGLVAGPDAITGFVYGRVYRREKFAAVRFPEGIAMLEDLRYWVDALAVDAKWYSFNYPLWAYRQHVQSVSHGVSARFLTGVFTQHVHVVRKLRDAFKANDRTVALYWSGVCGFFRAACVRMLKNWKRFSDSERQSFLADISATYSALNMRLWFVIKVSEKAYRLKLNFVLPWIGRAVSSYYWFYFGITARIKRLFKAS